jgi:site-specific DNA recombinase
MKPVRCAIYTRKSTEDGLEQAFNSLDAQREACAAYILSQRHEGWSEVKELYDDGGFSGGTMNRPGLAQLLDDVRSGKVDVIVVYKVDRLTRSLADFAKIVEVLDAAGASFVSITQAFNTTTSMGRLTLNVLLSFAQFEREVAGERIRDKIAASKRKGMWMGGNPSLGYDVRDRQLVVNEPEAGTVRFIMRRYVEVRSLRRLLAELKDCGIVTKRVGSRGGMPFARGSLHHLLRNPIYIGQTRYKGSIYPGQHLPIVDGELWERVQEVLSSQAPDADRGRRVTEESLLRGLLYDGKGRRLSPSHACKKGQRYRYYITPADKLDAGEKPLRLSASAVERIVVERLAGWLRSGAQEHPADDLELKLLEGTADADALQSFDARRARPALAKWIDRIVIYQQQLTIHLQTPDGEGTTISSTLGRMRRGNDVRLLLGGDAKSAIPARNHELVQTLADARAAQQFAISKPDASLGEVAAKIGQSERHTKRLLRLSFLAPAISETVLAGKQPDELTNPRLQHASHIPLCWTAQQQLFGIR